MFKCFSPHGTAHNLTNEENKAKERTKMKALEENDNNDTKNP